MHLVGFIVRTLSPLNLSVQSYLITSFSTRLGLKSGVTVLGLRTETL